MTVETPNDSHEVVRDHPPWTHDNPPTTDELEAEFAETTTEVVSTDAAERAFAALQSLPFRRFADAYHENSNPRVDEGDIERRCRFRFVRRWGTSLRFEGHR